MTFDGERRDRQAINPVITNPRPVLSPEPHEIRACRQAPVSGLSS